MNLSNENGDLILKIVGAIATFFTLRWIVRLFAGKDKILNLKEFKDFVAFGLFIWAFIYILLTEARRPVSSEHVFSEIWVFFIITALLSVLAKNEIFDSFSRALELLIRLRTKVSYESDTIKSTTSHSSTVSRTEYGIPDSSEAGQVDKEGA
jgi:hypothetical protein